jgi:hypothetical protein
VQDGTDPDTQTLAVAVVDAQVNLVKAESDAEIKEVTADKGYHSNDQLTELDSLNVRTYIPEPSSPHNRKWTDKPDDVKRAVLNNRRRTKRSKSKQLQRHRSERVERSFAHVCETGGARRTWLRGLEKINKRYSMVVAAHNLGLLMRSLFGSGKPREAAATAAAARFIHGIVSALLDAGNRLVEPRPAILALSATKHPLTATPPHHAVHFGMRTSSTGC